LLALQYPQLEIIVVDDGSSDSTLALLEREFALVPRAIFARQVFSHGEDPPTYQSESDPRLVVVHRLVNGGNKAVALNYGLDFCRYPYVCCVDGDTIYEPNALLKAIEEPAPRTVWLLCAPSADDLPTTIRSRCRLITLRTPSSAAVAAVLAREGIGHERALAAARAAMGHIGRARRLATDPEAAARRADVLAAAFQLGQGRPGGGLGQALAAAAALVAAADAETTAVTEGLDVPEREAMRQAFGEGSTGKGVAKAVRGAAGALKELEDRQKSRATRVKRDSLDRALLDLAGLYRDVLAIQLGADVELANAGQLGDIGQLAAACTPASTVRRIEAIMKCRERLAASVAPLLAVEEMTLALAAR